MLRNYLVDLDDMYLGLIDREVEATGTDEYLDRQLGYLDASRIGASGLRLEQTISMQYKVDVTKFLYAAKKYAGDRAKEWIDKLIELHDKNIAYEAGYPPIDYDPRKPKSKTRTRKVTEQLIFASEVPEKTSRLKPKLKLKMI